MKRYYTLDITTRSLVPLELPVAVDGRLVLHPTPAQAATHGAYPPQPRDTTAPTPPDGKVAVPDSWEVRDGQWVRTYRYEDAPPPAPRTFSKLRVTAALMAREKWLPVRDFLVQNGLYDLYLAAQDFREDDEFFVKGLASIKEQFGMADEEVEAILKEGEAQ